MKAVLIRVAAIAVFACPSGTAWGQTFKLSSGYSVEINGRDSTGQFVAPVLARETDEDDINSGVGTSRDGGMDIGSATIRAGAYASKGVTVFDPITGKDVDVPPKLGVQIAGSSTITRAPPSPITGLPQMGQLESRGNATATLEEAMTFGAPGSNPSQAIRIHGFLVLKGSLTTNTVAQGANVFADATGQIVVSSNVFPEVKRISHSSTVINPFMSILEPISYSFVAIPGAPQTVRFTMTAVGSASVFGSQQSGPGAGFGLAEFDSSFEHTLSWGGITSVTNESTGAPILDWTVTSASGFDYSKTFPIPEPSAGLLLLVGLGLFLGSRRDGRLVRSCGMRWRLGSSASLRT